MKNLRIITLTLLAICLLFSVNALAEPWHLSMYAMGQGLQVSGIVIGMDTNDNGAWPAPPLMPNYSAVIRILDPITEEYYNDDIRLEGSDREDWNLDVIVGAQTPDEGDPNAGTIADAGDPNFFPLLFWNPNEIVADGFMQVRLGDSNGPVLVGSMKTKSSYQTTQGDALATGGYYPESSLASIRYRVTYWTSVIDTQNIELIPGWNWVSFYVLPDDISLGAFFGAHANLIAQVKTQTRSATNVAGYGWIGDDLNLMSNISNGVMFKIKTNATSAFTFSVTGTRLPPDMTIGLQQNWTWIAYLPYPDCLTVEAVVSSILNDLYQIKSQTASKTKLPDGTLIGDLIEMCPGKGYVVKMNVPRDFTYPAP